jgi:hypothetical protein
MTLPLGEYKIDETEYCPEYTEAQCEQYKDNQYTNGKICSTDPQKHICKDGKCVPEDGEVHGVWDGVINQKIKLTDKLISSIKASSEGYILDHKTGIFTEILEGLYIFEYNGEMYEFSVNPNEKEILVYIDSNGNDIYDESIDTKVSDIASEINIVALEQSYNYELTEGFNFVSFPFLISGEEYRTAAGLLQKLNEVYNDAIYSISKYDGRWKIVGQNSELYDANDFQLLPGQGYVIKAKEDVSITLTGQPVKYDTTTDTAPVTLFEGWNLIGLYGTGVKTYTAKTLIADINASDFTADNVTKWVRDKQMYEGFQFSENQEYGFDFPINSLESYFVRILEGRGNWQPKLRTQ